MLTTKVYCIPGFGADDFFSKLKISAHLKCISWVKPVEQEPIALYAHRMAVLITEKNPIIVGVSFGGMIAIEISKILNLRQIILISSIKNRKELPVSLKIIRRLRLDKAFPVKRISQTSKTFHIANRRLGAVTPEEISAIINQALSLASDTNPVCNFEVG